MFIGGPHDYFQKFLSARDIKKNLNNSFLQIIKVQEFDNKLFKEDSYDEIPKKLRDNFTDLLRKDKEILSPYVRESKKVETLVEQHKEDFGRRYLF